MKNISYVIGGAPVQDGVKANIKDNLYMNINYEWLKNTKIPDDKPATGSFQNLDESVKKTLINDFNLYQKGEINAPNDMFKEAMKMYKLATNFDIRKEQGTEPLKKIIKRIEKVNSLDDFNEILNELIIDDFILPFSINIEPDWKNTFKNTIFIYASPLILPDKTFYNYKVHKNSPKLLDIWSEMSQKLLINIGYDKSIANKMVEEAKQFDQSIVPYVMTSEELADQIKLYNPWSISDISNNIKNLKIQNALKKLFTENIQQIIVTQPTYFKAIDKIINSKTFKQMKSWIVINNVNRLSKYLDEDTRQISDSYHKAISGIKKSLSKEKFAYSVVNDTFTYVIGDYYGKKYFGEDAKKDATNMVKSMINIYKKRLQNNTWLGNKTKDKAILKLEKMVIKVGFPEKIKDVYRKIKISNNKEDTLLENYINIQKIMIKDNFEKINKPVDRTEWDMPSQLVNACYDPSHNDITFPAAILSNPFYDLKQSHSKNYGGIGCVMGHEISHAFDNNGANFDEYGNMVNWWSNEDASYFKKLTQKMINEFDGIPFADEKVNGKLCVSENIADNGGMSCAMEALKEYSNYDLKEFFVNWVTIWRTKSSKQYKQMLLAIDVHAPEELRGNVQPQNFEEFFKTFNITNKDGMWLDPNKRVNIW